MHYQEAPVSYRFVHHSSVVYIPDLVEGPSQYTNFVFDHFGSNITAEDNVLEKP